MKAVNIGPRLVGDGHLCFIIAEIGINHNGSLEMAKKLIDAAIKASCDAVKFQKRTINVVYSSEELAKSRESMFGETNGDLKYGLELGEREYREINRYCAKNGILCFASPWDEASVDFLEQFRPPCYKIASACLTDDGLLKHTRSKGRPVILSTGMSDMDQVRHAVDVLGESDLIILQCVATYPSEASQINLSVIKLCAWAFMIKKYLLELPKLLKKRPREVHIL